MANLHPLQPLLYVSCQGYGYFDISTSIKQVFSQVNAWNYGNHNIDVPKFWKKKILSDWGIIINLYQNI